MIDDATVVMPYSGVYIAEVANVLEEVAPGIPAKQRGTVCRHILDALYNAGMLSESPWRINAATWRNRAIAAEQQRDKAMSQATIREHSRSWVHVKTQLELDQALKVVRLAEALRGAADPEEHARALDALFAAVDEWLKFSYDEQPDPTRVVAGIAEETSDNATVDVAEPLVTDDVEPTEEASEPVGS